MKRPRSRSWEPKSQLTPSSKRGGTAPRPGTRHQRSQTAGSAFSRPRKQREQFRSALVKLILYVKHIDTHITRNSLQSKSRHGKVDEEEEEGSDSTTTTKERSSSPTSAEIDLLVHTLI